VFIGQNGEIAKKGQIGFAIGGREQGETVFASQSAAQPFKFPLGITETGEKGQFARSQQGDQLGQGDLVRKQGCESVEVD
jgi:hypothetical protein